MRRAVPILPTQAALSLVLFALFILFLSSPLWANVGHQSGLTVSSRVDAVTVYRGQALVSRVVRLPAKKGELEVVVDGLPNAVVSTSLAAQASAQSGVTVRAIRYRHQLVARSPKAAVAKLDDLIARLRQKHRAVGERLWLVNNQFKVIEGQMGFIKPATKHDMSRGVLDPKKLAAVTEANLKHRERLVERRITLRQEQGRIATELQLARRKRAKLTRGTSRARRQAVIFVHKTTTAPSQLRLDYLVRGAHWTPTYNVRRKGETNKVRLEYLAEVRQMTGEDWRDAKVTLSTATPKMTAESPVLGPLWIGVGGTKRARRPRPTKLTGYLSSRARIRRAQESLRGNKDRSKAGWLMNKLAADSQDLELNVSADVVKAGRRGVRAAEDALAVSYRLSGRMSVASRRDQQLVQIAALQLSAQTFYEAVPLFSSYVTRYARIINDTDVPLLAGTYRAYVDGDFVGTGDLPVVATEQDFTVGFGADPQLRCYRELVDKEADTSWGSRLQRFKYRLRLESYKRAPVNVQVFDRIPATKSKQIEITLSTGDSSLSRDPVYQRDKRPRGILRWDLKLAPKSNGERATDVHYSFELKYAKDAKVGRQARGLLREMQRDYLRMVK